MAIIESIKELIDFSFSDKTYTNMVVVIGIVDEEQAKLIFARTGFDVSGFKRVIDKFSIQRAFRNNGNADTETRSGRKAIIKSDFEKIPNMVKIKGQIYPAKSYNGRDCIVHEITLDEPFLYIEEIRVGKKQLIMNSLSKEKLIF